MRPTHLLLTAALLLPVPALAQTPPAPAPASTPAPEAAQAGTLLRLTGTGTVSVAPDVLVVDLAAQATSHNAAAAQRRVNELMASAMQAARAVPGVEPRATQYAMTPTDEKHTAWNASQVLELRGADGAALLDLAGKLQDSGMNLRSADWQLSTARRKSAHDQAMTEALKDMQAQAAAAASTLGLKVARLRQVQLGGGLGPMPSPMPMGVMARMAAPQATASDMEVSATVSADVLLR